MMSVDVTNVSRDVDASINFFDFAMALGKLNDQFKIDSVRKTAGDIFLRR